MTKKWGGWRVESEKGEKGKEDVSLAPCPCSFFNLYCAAHLRSFSLSVLLLLPLSASPPLTLLFLSPPLIPSPSGLAVPVISLVPVFYGFLLLSRYLPQAFSLLSGWQPLVPPSVLRPAPRVSVGSALQPIGPEADRPPRSPRQGRCRGPRALSRLAPATC